MGASCRERRLDSASATRPAHTKAVGLVPGGDCWGMGERVPIPRENPVSPGAGVQQALEIMFRRGREQTDHLLWKEMRGKQEMETWKGQGPTKFLSRSSCPHPPDGSLLGPSGRKSLHCLSHSPPRSPLSPPSDPCCLASEGWSLRLDLGGQRKKQERGVGIS